jgi:hypothetical protein
VIVTRSTRPRGCGRRTGHGTASDRHRRRFGLKLTVLLLMLALFLVALLVGAVRSFV